MLMRSTMPRLRARTRPMSIVMCPVSVSYRAALRAKCAILALQISFLLGRHGVTSAADPPTLHDGSARTRSRHMPSKQPAAHFAAQDQDLKPLWVGHGFLPCAPITENFAPR